MYGHQLLQHYDVVMWPSSSNAAILVLDDAWLHVFLLLLSSGRKMDNVHTDEHLVE